jgi:hypothetical protein
MVRAPSSSAFAFFLLIFLSFIVSSAPAFTFIDPITQLRCEWVAGMLYRNQIPYSAKIALQLGVEDGGRALYLLPHSVKTFVTSTSSGFLDAAGTLSLFLSLSLSPFF